MLYIYIYFMKVNYSLLPGRNRDYYYKYKALKYYLKIKGGSSFVKNENNKDEKLKDYQNQKDIIIKIIETSLPSRVIDLFQNLSEELKNDKDIIIKIIETSVRSRVIDLLFQNLSEELKNDKDIIIK